MAACTQKATAKRPAAVPIAAAERAGDPERQSAKDSAYATHVAGLRLWESAHLPHILVAHRRVLPVGLAVGRPGRARRRCGRRLRVLLLHLALRRLRRLSVLLGLVRRLLWVLTMVCA